MPKLTANQKADRKYLAKLDELLGKSDRLADNEVGKVLDLLERLRLQVADTVVNTEWQAYRLAEMTRAIDEAVATFKQGYTASQSTALGNMWEVGQDMVAAPLAEIGFAAAITQLPRTTLEVLQAYSGDLIGGLAADAKKKVVAEITNGVLGGKSQIEVMRAIGKNLKDKGTFDTLAARAEAITRTEMASVQSAARQARQEATIAATPGVTWHKKWLASGKIHSRPNHAALNGASVPVKMNFSFAGDHEPVKPPGGIPYPHAPGLPAKEVVHCGCVHILVAPEWDQLPKDEHAVYHERAIYD